MRSILSDARSGAVSTFEIPAPELRPGGILVRTAFSAISAGTERATLETSKKSLLGKALARPDLVKQVLDYARVNGAIAAYHKVQARLDNLTALGYSCSGTVLAVADDVTDFRPGDRVACGGVGYATHADVNFIPRNLAVRVPDAVPLDAAALATIGAIAMQGLRQAQIAFGETIAVIGAGLLGILAIQIARAAGCRVIAIDVNAVRAEKAMQFGASAGLLASDPATPQRVRELSRYGVDAAVITASAPNADPVELAAGLLRDRGRIAVVGAVGLGVSREPMYRKELSLALSRSYGPGRYDPAYEEQGIDYPVGHVRWTERRNMEAFLDLLAGGAVDVSALTAHRFSIADGANAYEHLKTGGIYTVLLEYASQTEAAIPVPSTSRAAHPGELLIGCIGAGGFARGTIFPHLRAIGGVALEAVASASGAAAISAQKTFGFARTRTASALIADPDVDAVFILSRHDSHARYVVEALKLRKPVFVEKPLALTPDELRAILDAYHAECAQHRSSFVMVGFNRRFAPATERMVRFFAGRAEPMVIHIRVNAGYIPRGHWTQQPAGGGRIVGELCHFLDWARAVVGAPIVSVTAQAIPDGALYQEDNVAAILTFADGSVANLLYLANGDTTVPKEEYEVFCARGIARLHDFDVLELVRNGKRRRIRCGHDKGHRRELELTAEAMRTGAPSPIAFAELVEVTATTFAIRDALHFGIPVRIDSVLPCSRAAASV